MAEEFKPNDTTTLSVKTAGGASATIQSKKFDVIVWVIFAAGLAWVGGWVYGIKEEMKAQTQVITSRFSEMAARTTALESSVTYLACVNLATEEARRSGAHTCKVIARVP